MNWECSQCGERALEYACLGYGSEIDHGCPKCGCKEIWFRHFGYPAGNPDTRWLINVETSKVLKKQRIHQVITVSEIQYEDYEDDPRTTPS